MSETMKSAKTAKHVVVHAELCKGCGRCVVACPEGNLETAEVRNHLGLLPMRPRSPQHCRGCGLCFYNCPEPGAIVVVRGEE